MNFGELLKCLDRACAVLEARHGDPAEWPQDLRVREFPQV